MLYEQMPGFLPAFKIKYTRIGYPRTVAFRLCSIVTPGPCLLSDCQQQARGNHLAGCKGAPIEMPRSVAGYNAEKAESQDTTCFLGG